MEKSTENLFLDVIDELKNKYSENQDIVYKQIYMQIEFVYDCMKNKKDIRKELKGRELNFMVIASRNFSGPEEALKERVGEIGLIVGML